MQGRSQKGSQPVAHPLSKSWLRLWLYKYPNLHLSFSERQKLFNKQCYTRVKTNNLLQVVVMHSVNNVVNFSHNNNVVIYSIVQSSIYCYNLLTRLSSNDNNNEQACFINIVFSCFNNLEQPLLLHQSAEQHSWNNSEQRGSLNNIVQ